MSEAPGVDDVEVSRSGLVAIVGRPNVGKSTLVNAMVGEKVSITSDKPQTTRHRILGVLADAGRQAVLVDTPGLHKPVTSLGERLNATTAGVLADVDHVVVVIDATQPVGSGDRWVLARTPASATVVLNKTDRVDRATIARQLAALATHDRAAYFAVSARTGDGVEDLAAHLLDSLGEGPAWFPPGQRTDLTEPAQVAELVREQLLRVLRDELPYSVATRTVEWDWPRIAVDIYVERESQKGMVIGKGAKVLAEVGHRVRRQLPDGVYLALHVRVLADWQRRPELVERVLHLDDVGGD